MSRLSLSRLIKVVVALVLAAFLWPAVTSAGPAPAAPGQFFSSTNEDGDDAKPKKKKKKKKKKKRSKKKIRWGQKLSETNAEYDKRYARVFKRIRKPRKGDWTGGLFTNRAGEETSLWTYMGHPGCPFIVRTDISQEFTAQFVMYLENLHREYGAVYKRLLGKPARFKEKVEIITFADQATYISAGGMRGSAGQFGFMYHLINDRALSWPARHYRIMQFTSGVTEFSKWPKDTLRHECSHMELQMRLGYKLDPTKAGLAWPIKGPLWWNEGLATVFEGWDLDKSVDENIAEIPNRGDRAPYVRRMYGTDDWWDFNHFWTQTDNRWRSRPNVFLNYCQAWSLVSYMITGGAKGRADFRRIYDLSLRVGINNVDVSVADRKIGWSRAWAEKFPPEAQDEMAKNWSAWVEKNVPKDGVVPDEEYTLRQSYVDPSVTKRLQRFETPEEMKENKKWLEKEKRRRKKSKVIHR